MKKLIGKVICGLCICFVAYMLFLHRGLIIAAIKGEEIPKAPEGCPAYKG